MRKIDLFSEKNDDTNDYFAAPSNITLKSYNHQKLNCFVRFSKVNTEKTVFPMEVDRIVNYSHNVDAIVDISKFSKSKLTLFVQN